MSVVTDLQEARELILKEDRWTQEAYARNEKGVIVSPDSKDACQWCVLGAVRKVTGYPGTYATSDEERSEAFKRFGECERLLFGNYDDLVWYGPVEVNDNLGHSATIEMLDNLIARAKGQE